MKLTCDLCGGELQVNAGSQASRAKAVFAQTGVGCIHFYTDYRNKVRTALR